MTSLFLRWPQRSTWRGFMQYSHSCKKLDWSYNPLNANFFKTSVVYLGNKISKEGVWTDDHKVEAIKNWPIPSMITELQRFLGFMNYYCHFIKGYAKVTHPLYNLISGNNATQKKKKVMWMAECQGAFNTLKALCTSAPILTFGWFYQAL